MIIDWHSPACVCVRVCLQPKHSFQHITLDECWSVTETHTVLDKLHPHVHDSGKLSMRLDLSTDVCDVRIESSPWLWVQLCVITLLHTRML